MAFIYDLTDTWNAGGTTFSAIKMNVTDTASASASKLVQCQISGTDKFTVGKDGGGYFAGNVGIGTSSPSNQLSVAGNNSATISFDWTGDNAAKASIAANHSTGEVRYTAVTNYFPTFYSNNAERMRIASSGRVGVATSDPNASLHIGSSNATGNATNPALQIGGTTSYRLGLYTSAEGGIIENKNGDDGLQFRVKTAGEAMRVTSAGSVGIGTASPSAVGSRTTLNVSGSAGSAIRLSDDTANAFIDYTDGSGARFSVNAAEPLLLQTNSAERMRIDSSGNLGVGTSSPQARIHANTTLIPIKTSGPSSGSILQDIYVTRTSSGTSIQSGPNITFEDGTANNSITVQNSQGNLTFWNYGSGAWNERMRIDSSGNVGIGTSSPAAKLDVDGGDIYVRTSGRVLTDTVQGYTGLSTPLALSAAQTVTISTASSERMRITSAGNVGIGTSSPDSKVDIEAANSQLRLTDSDDSKFAEFSYSSGKLVVRNNSTTTTTEQFTLDGSGRLGIGTISPAAKLHVADAVNGKILISGSSTSAELELSAPIPKITFTDTSGSAVDGEIKVDGSAMQFGMGGSERMRITSFGELALGCTSSQENATSGASGHFIRPTSYPIFASDGAIALLLNRTGSDGQIAQFRKAGSTVGFISVTTSATTYNTSSDYRLKDIDGPVANSGAYIDALKPVQGSWKADGSRFIGLLAHEVQEVSETQIATGEKDGEEMQAMDYSSPELIANLIAEIQSLRARVAQLEG